MHVPMVYHVEHSPIDAKRPTLLNIRSLDSATAAQPLPDAHSMTTSYPRSGSMSPRNLRPSDWQPPGNQRGPLRLRPWTRIDARNPPGAQGYAMFSKNFSRETSSSKAGETFWETPEDDLSSKSSFAFHPCTPAGARASAAPQGRRPKLRPSSQLTP